MIENKKQNISLLLSYLLIACMVMSCSEEEKIEEHYLDLSVSSFTFDAAGEKELVLEISSNPNWTIQKVSEVDWLEEIERTTDYIVYRAIPNLGVENRTTELTVTAGDQAKTVELDQLENYSFSKYKILDTAYTAVVSHNGKYIAFLEVKKASSDSKYQLFRMDVDSGEKERIYASGEEMELYTISDQGIIMGYIDDEQLVGAFSAPNEFQELELDEDHFDPTVIGSNSDGSILVGAVKDFQSYRDYPAKWVNGKLEVLERPELDIYDRDPFTEGGAALGCSEDGRVVYGATTKLNSALCWIDGKFSYIGKDLAKEETILVEWLIWEFEETYHVGLRTKVDCYGVSNNGKYVALQYNYVVENDPFVSPAVFNTETGEIEIISLDEIELPTGDIIGASSTYISDDKQLFYGFLNSSETVTGGYHYDMSSKACTPVYQYVNDEFGVIVKDKNLYIQMLTSENDFAFGQSVQQLGSSVYYIPWYVFK